MNKIELEKRLLFQVNRAKHLSKENDQLRTELTRLRANYAELLNELEPEQRKRFILRKAKMQNKTE